MTVPAADSIAFLTGDLARLLRRSFEQAIASEGFDLTVGEARTLYYVARCPEARQAELAERMHVEPMTLSNFLDRLEQKGLIARRLDPRDRRAKHALVTRAAEPLVKRISTLAHEVRASATVGFSASEVETLRRMLQRMRENLTARESAPA